MERRLEILQMSPLRFATVFACALLLFAPIETRAAAAAPESATHVSATTIPSSALIQPAELARLLHASGSPPIILQVGFRVLYTEAHIAGAQYAGPGSNAAGIQNLKNHVTSLPRGRLVVIYCGCCPWTRCPNIAPAYDQLHAWGFSNVKVLYLADNFGADWVDKGYPVIRGK